MIKWIFFFGNSPKLTLFFKISSEIFLKLIKIDIKYKMILTACS